MTMTVSRKPNSRTSKERKTKYLKVSWGGGYSRGGDVLRDGKAYSPDSYVMHKGCKRAGIVKTAKNPIKK